MSLSLLLHSVLLLLGLAGFLPVVIVVHRTRQRRAERQAGRQVPTQGIALTSMFTVLVPAIAGLWTAGLAGAYAPAWCAWASLVLAGLGYGYWIFICMTESGRRYMIAEMVAQQPGIAPAEIVRRYDRRQILTARLERLELWHTLGRQGDRYVAAPTTMLLASRGVRLWAALLGFGWARDFKKQTSQPR